MSPGEEAMPDTDTPELGLLAKLVIAFGVALIVAGMLWHGVATETFKRIWQSLVQRPSGPVAFRFFLQPAMAAIAAIYDGLKDVRTGRSPYFRTVLRKPHERVARLGEGLNATARIILLGLAMDTIYQVIELKKFYPFEALIMALLLAFVPYLLIRGPAARLAHWRSGASPRRIS
jgi:hypothetical protein